MADIDLKGRPVIVTGGGSGLGKAMCLSLAGHGAHAVAAEVNPQHAKELLAEARTEGCADRVHVVETDVTDPDSAKACAAKVIAQFGTIFGLVNCAGRGYPTSEVVGDTRSPRLWEMKPSGWLPVVKLNLCGPFYMTRAVVDEMMKRREGRIVNVTTSYGTMQRIGMMPYGATKAALETLTMAWSDELKGSGVNVNVLIPGGAVDTRILPDPPGQGLRAPHVKLLHPDVMRAPIVWLMSDRARSVTRWRYIGVRFDPAIDPDAAAERAGWPAGWEVPEGQSGAGGLAAGFLD